MDAFCSCCISHIRFLNNTWSTLSNIPRSCRTTSLRPQVICCFVGSNNKQTEQSWGAWYRISPHLCRSLWPSRRYHDRTRPDEGRAPVVTQVQVPSHLLGQSEIILLDRWVESRLSGEGTNTSCAVNRKSIDLWRWSRYYLYKSF